MPVMDDSLMLTHADCSLTRDSAHLHAHIMYPPPCICRLQPDPRDVTCGLITQIPCHPSSLMSLVAPHVCDQTPSTHRTYGFVMMSDHVMVRTYRTCVWCT